MEQCNRFLNGLLVAVVFAGGGMGVARAADATTPEGLEAARQEAVKLVQSGQRLKAARLLLDTLCAIPSDQPNLAGDALGVLDLFLFTNEYLLFDAEATALYKTSFPRDLGEDPTQPMNHPVHQMLRVLMRYGDDAGMTQAETDYAYVETIRLSHCDSKVVQVWALDALCDPYFMHESDAIRQAADRFQTEYPGCALAKNAQRKILFSSRKGGVEKLAEAMGRPTPDQSPNEHAKRLKQDPFGLAIADAMKEAPGNREAVLVARLAQLADKAEDWADEYAALNLLEGFRKGQQAGLVRQAMTRAIDRASDPRIVFRARGIRITIDRKGNQPKFIFDDTNALLDTPDIPALSDRHCYEDLKDLTRHSAERLAELGHSTKAIQLLEKLAARFPGSLLEARAREQIETTKAGTPKP